VDERGAPLSGATVVVTPGRGRRGTSGEGGRFRVEGPATRERETATVVAMLGERTPGVTVVEHGEPRGGIVLELGLPAPLVGRVVDGKGKPRATAVVRLSTKSGPNWHRGSNPLVALTGEDERSIPAAVDAEGRFRIAGLPEGTYRIAAWPTPDALWYVASSARVPTDRDVVVVVDDGAILRGVVVDPRGAPVAGASVRVDWGPAIPRDVLPGESDEQGRFELAGVPKGPFHASVDRPGYDRWSGEVDAAEGVRVVLEPLRTVVLRIALEGAADMASVAVHLEPRNGSSTGHHGSHPVTPGGVEIETTLLPGAYELRIEGPTHVGGPVPVEVPKGDGDVTARVRLSPAPAVAGVVLGSDGAPRAGATVRFWQLEPPRVPVEEKTDARGRFRFAGAPGTGRLDCNVSGFLPVGRRVTVGVEDVVLRLVVPVEVTGRIDFADPSTDRSGWQVLLVAEVPSEDASVPGTVVAGDGTFRGAVAPGEYRAHASRGPTHGPAVPFTAKAGTPVRDLRLATPAGLAIAGRVLSPAGEPESGASVHAFRLGDGGVVASATTDAEGRFQVEGLSAAEHRLHVFAPMGRAHVSSVAAGTRELEIRLTATGQVRGRVIDGQGRDVGEAVVVANGERFGGWQARCQPDGRYAFDGVHPGPHRFHARAGSRVASSDAVEVRAGEVHRGVDLLLVEGGAIEGVVADAAGKPVAGAWVSAGNDFGVPGPGLATTDEDGRYRLEGLAAGTWSLSAGHERLGPVMKSAVAVRLGRSETVDLSPSK
jgi:hypothetical protein